MMDLHDVPTADLEAELKRRQDEAKAAAEAAEPRVCWLCKKPDATIRTHPQPPDNEAWWFHEKCYWEMQDILN